jgi:hypothetical protein
MKFHDCLSCDAHFRVISESDELIEYCPFCGDPIEHLDLEIDDIEEEY